MVRLERLFGAPIKNGSLKRVWIYFRCLINIKTLVISFLSAFRWASQVLCFVCKMYQMHLI